MSREPLPNRRGCRTLDLRFCNQDFAMSVGSFADGRPAEVFVTGAKAGSDVQSLSRDGAILLSLALQFGVPLDMMRHAISRNEQGEPTSLIGAMADSIAVEAV